MTHHFVLTMQGFALRRYRDAQQCAADARHNTEPDQTISNIRDYCASVNTKYIYMYDALYRSHSDFDIQTVTPILT